MEKLDKERYLKRVIIVCWIALAICLVIKIFFGNLFEIMCSNENFIKICNYAENNYWLNYLLNCLYCFVSLFFFTLAICGKMQFEKWELIVAILTVMVGTLVKSLGFAAGVVFDVWQGIIFPCVITIKTPKRHKYVIPANVMLFVFQFVSMYIKSIYDFVVMWDEVFLGMIYSIDVLIMLALYYLYSNIINIRKEKTS